MLYSEGCIVQLQCIFIFVSGNFAYQYKTVYVGLNNPDVSAGNNGQLDGVLKWSDRTSYTYQSGSGMPGVQFSDGQYCSVYKVMAAGSTEDIKGVGCVSGWYRFICEYECGNGKNNTLVLLVCINKYQDNILMSSHTSTKHMIN